MKNEKGLVDQVFCANCAVVWGGKALISSMLPPRREETPHALSWFKSKNFEVRILLSR